MFLPKFQRLELILLLIIVAAGSFLRLYHLPQTLMFRGDQGRDAIIAKRILKDNDIALIGPVTSVGNMYLGPFYYYFMVPFLALTYPSPLGPAYGVALVNILTIVALYLAARPVFGKAAAMMGAGIFSLMANAILYGRFSWNPNIAPLFSVLLLWSLLRWWQERSTTQTVLMWLWLGILAQLHYVSLTTVAVVMGLMIIGSVTQKTYFQTAKQIMLGIFVFILTQAPLIAFDFRHDHLIWQQFVKFIFSPEKHMGLSTVVTKLSIIPDKISLVMADLIGVSSQRSLNSWLSWLGLLTAAMLLYRAVKKQNEPVGPFILLLWLLTTIGGISFYSHTVFPHYLTYSYPIIALFWGWLTVSLWRQRWLKPVSLVLAVILSAWLVKGWQTLHWDGLGTSVIETMVRQTLPLVKPPYNIVLLSDDHDYKGMSYRYFFETSNIKPQEIDDYNGLQSVVIIDEVNTDEPRSVPIYEIESAKDFSWTNTVSINPGPRALILEKE